MSRAQSKSPQASLPADASAAGPRPPAPAPRQAPREALRPQAPLRNVQLGPRAVGSWVPRLTRPAFEKFGFSAATLITDWATIVGPAIAAYAAPERLKWPKLPRSDGADDEPRPAATLVLAVDPGRALDVQYRARQLVERINAYFGYRAVADLRIVQTPMAPPAGSSARPPVPMATAGRPTAPPPEVAAVADEGLRSALLRMAAGVSARRL